MKTVTIDIVGMVNSIGKAWNRATKANRKASLACVAIVLGFAWARYKFKDLNTKIDILQREIDNLREED